MPGWSPRERRPTSSRVWAAIARSRSASSAASVMVRDSSIVRNPTSSAVSDCPASSWSSRAIRRRSSSWAVTACWISRLRSSSARSRSVMSVTTPITPMTSPLPSSCNGAMETDTGTSAPPSARKVVSALLFSRCPAATRASNAGCSVGGTNWAQRRADYAPERHPHDVGEPPVAIGDRAVPRQGHGALVHLIEQDAVRQLRACEGDDVLPPRPRDHDGIHFTGPDGAERLLGRFQPVPQLPDSSQRPARGLAFLGHGGRRLLLVVTRQHIQPDQHALHIREVTDDLADRRRQLSHQRRNHDDVVPARQVRFVEEVDDLDAVAAGEVAVAQALQIGEGGNRFRRLPRHVQPQPPGSARSVLHFTPRRRRGFGSLPGAGCWRASRAAPIATLPSARRLTSSSTMPRSVITNSRTWFECAMPRALTIWIVRLRSPFARSE